MTKFIATAATRALFQRAPLIGLTTQERQQFDTIAQHFLAGPPEATPDLWFSYYQGQELLAAARQRSALIDLIAATFWHAQRRGLVSLRQRRADVTAPYSMWSYEARLSLSGRIPIEALQSRVGSSPSPAFNGNAPVAMADGSLAPPSRIERQDGIGRPSLEQLETPHGPE